VERTESFLGELGSPRGPEPSDCLTRYLGDLELLGCRAVNLACALIEAVSRGRGSELIEEDSLTMSEPVMLTLDFLRAHYMERITWRNVAASLRRNPAYLARRFRRETGTTLRQHVSELRIRQAAEQLVNGDKVEGTMLSVGYRSKRTFYSHFRTTFGVTPGVYRMVCRERPRTRR
jgi:AraC-like DNA-binding protein